MGVKYLFFIPLFLIVFTSSSLINLSGPGAIIVGLRNYFKTIPLFILPAVYQFDTKNLMSKTKFILLLLLLQCPLALYQRLIQFGLGANGDHIRGSLDTSGVLSFMMLAAISILNGVYQKRLIKLSHFLIISLVLFIPTTINETKVTLIYLPIAIGIPFILNNDYDITKKLRKLTALSVISILLLAAFIPIYDYFMRPKWGHGIFEFISSGKIVEYVYSGTPENPNTSWKRGDRVVLAVRNVSGDLKTMFFGFGPGNVAVSYFDEFQDKSVESAANANAQAITNLIWENGFLGLFSYLLLLLLVFKDSLVLKNSNSLIGGIALGWCTIVILSGLNLFYQNILKVNIVNYLFWFYSGVIVAENFRMQQKDRVYQQVNVERYAGNIIL
jgi:hypothetical protein